MFGFYNAFNIAQKIFFWIAVPATVFLFIQTLLVILGFDNDHDADGDFSGDHDCSGDHDHSGGISLFSLRSLIAFFTMTGWTGVWLAGTGMSPGLYIPISALVGVAAFIGMGFLIGSLMKLQSEGNLEINNAVGKTATVYLTIPEERKGKGKVNMTIQERFVEFDAITDSSSKLQTGSFVKVIEKIDDGTVLVEEIKK